MRLEISNIRYSIVILLLHLTMGGGICAFAQEPAKTVEKDSASIAPSHLSKAEMKRARIKADSLMTDSATLAKELKKANNEIKRNWKPDPKRALWMSLVIPGGGQIYNHKYWKLPFVYGGFMGCAYALSWNNMMYRDYSKAYVDLLDDDPTTTSYKDFLSTRYQSDSYVEQNKERLVALFKRKKNYFRRYRDLSMFCVVGVYLLSVVDAYVDAELSSFDISKDLSMKVTPAVINNQQRVTSFRDQSYGVQCSLNF